VGGSDDPSVVARGGRPRREAAAAAAAAAATGATSDGVPAGGPPPEAAPGLWLCGRVEHLVWLRRLLGWGARSLYERRVIAELNPLGGANHWDALCCAAGAGAGDATTVPVAQCGRPCDEAGVFNILSVFPE